MKFNRKRKNGILIYLNDDELLQLNMAVKQSGYNRSVYIRSLLLGYIPQSKPTEDFYEMIVQLRRIGTNLNQIALVANRTGSIDIIRYKKDIEDLNQSILEIRKRVLLPSEI